jgi:hypothetical protein
MAEKHEIRTKQKKKFFEEGMKEDHVLLHLDARRSGVEVPAHLKDNPALALKVSYLFQGKTTHDDKAVTSYLKFSGDYHECVIPWLAIWGITTSKQKNQIWPEDVPKELVLQLARAKIAELGHKLFGGRDKTAEPEQEDLQKTPQSAEEPGPDKKPGGGGAHLTRIK